MKLQLGSLFQDHMVAQRDRPLPVWGWAAPGRKISVTLGQAHAAATVGSDGRWRAMLPPQPAAGPLVMTVAAGKEVKRLDDVWLGEVWLASGQSNMEMKVQSCYNAVHEVADGSYPGIRVWTTERVIALTPQERVGGLWQVCTRETVGGFTAVGYFFARELHRELGVAVGIIDSSWGGTVAEAWTSRTGLLGAPAHRGFVDRLDRLMGPEGQVEREAFAKVQAEWEASIPHDSGNAGEADGWHLPDHSDDDWKRMTLPTGWQVAGCDISGVFWFRRTVEIPPAWEGRPLDLHVGACDKRDYTYYDGRFLGSLGQEDSPTAWNTPRVYQIPADAVRAGRRVIAVRVFSNIYQGGMIGPRHEMWVAPAGADPSARLPLDGEWRYRIEQDYGRVESSPPPAPYGAGNPNTPTALFNSMIAPLIPFALKGFLWYQGESNAARAIEYYTLFPNLIRDWRRQFGQGDLPFHFVQLANYMGMKAQPTESNWALVREAQRLAMDSVANTGMAVIIDIGDAQDIHPKNKQDVGRRLALRALAGDYGRDDVTGTSPLPCRVLRCGASVLVRFVHDGGGMAACDGGSPVGFALAGADRVFHWAEAALDGTDGVTLHCDAVPEPFWVRYAWADNPRCNLYGGTGLPASPFESAIPAGEWLAE